MADNTIGSALVIPASLLKDLQEADKRIEKIGQSSALTAAAFVSNFQRMTTSVKDLNEALKLTVQHMGDLSGKFKAADLAGLTQAARDANQLSTGITKAAENVERLNATTKQTAQTSKEASVTFEEAMKAYGNYNSIKEATEALKKLKAARDSMQMRNGTGANDEYASNLATLNNAIATLSKRVKDLQKDEATLAREQEKAAQAADREALAQQRLNERLESQRARQAAQAAYERNTTYQGSLSYAESATTINQRTQAIRYLTVARNELSTTDAAYTQKLATLNAKIKEMNALNKEAIAGSKELNTHHRSLMNTADQLRRSLALVFSVSAIRGYITELMRVRGEFELQQRSLEAILQDKPVADEIFEKTVRMAVQSPFTVRQLVTYTKQLAAFRIESDKLYDTTKRLSDVSAGLGVSMDRIILAYGQVKAAAYLRGQEVRQFTEAGINLYAELQRYYEEVRGEAYTTGEIVKMISKRMVTFEDVDAVMHRLTDEGGIFYRMQEIQAETLRGRLSNLRDSLDVMLNSIGLANEGVLKGSIEGIRTLLLHWEQIADALKIVVPLFALLRLQAWRAGVAMSTVFTGQFVRASKSSLGFMYNGSMALANLKIAALSAASGIYNLGRSLVTAFAANWVTVAITAIVGTIMTYRNHQAEVNRALEEARSKSNELASSLHKLEAEYVKLSKVDNPDEDNFKERRQQLMQLRKMYEDAHLTIDVDIEGLDEDNIDEAFKAMSDGYEQYVSVKERVDAAYADVSTEMEGIFHVLGDNITTDVKQARDAYDEVIRCTNEYSKELEELSHATWTQANEQTRMLIVDAQTRREGEKDIDYVTRMRKALVQLTGEGGGAFVKLDKRLEEFYHEVDKVMEKVHDSFTDTEWAEEYDTTIRAAILKIAEDHQWGDYLTRKALEHLKMTIEVDVDEKQVDEKIDWLKEMIQRSLDDHEFNVNLSFDGTIFDKLEKRLKKAEQTYKDAETYAERARSGGSFPLGAVEDNDRDFKEWLETAKENYSALLDWADKDMEIPEQVLLDYIQFQKDSSKNIMDAYGYIMKEDQKKIAKAERDIWNERINILKEMNSEYNKLRKTMSVADAQKTVADEYRNAAEYVRMQDVLDISTWFANDENTANMIDKLKEMVAKATSRLSAEKDVAKLRIGIDEEAFNKELERIKKSVDEAFDGLSLTERLTGAGLHDYQVQMIFPNIAMSFEQVEKRIRDEYGMTSEMLAKTVEEQQDLMGLDKYKAYTEAMKKLDDERLKQQRSTIEQLVKDYKNVLDEQVKLDVWYAKERKKIYDDAYNLDPAMQQEMERNLNRQYQSQSQRIAWDDFTNSGFYTLMFSQIEYASKTSLELMRKKLEEIRDAMGDLDPENLKQIADLESKLDERTVNVAPWQTLTATFKDMVTFLRERKDLEQQLAESQRWEDQLTALQRQIALRVQEMEIEADGYAKMAERTSEEEESYKALLDNIAKERDDLNAVTEELDKQVANTKKVTENIEKGQRAQNMFAKATSEMVKRWGDVLATVQAMVDNWDQLFGSASDWMHDFLDVMMECANASLMIGQGIESITKGDTFSGIASALQGTISLVASLFSIKDRRLERQIKKLQEETDNLAKSYERLSNAMADAWDITRLQTYRNEMEKTIKAEITNYEEMIRLEEEKKKTDDDKIKEYREAIEDLYDELDELSENFYEALGGFGSQANYKSAAEEFADAWMDAFKEGSDTLAALNDEFNDLFANLLTKQISTRLAEAYLQPIMDAMDNALVDANGNARDLDTTMSMLAEAWQGIDAAAEGYNEAANQIMELLKSYGLDLTEGAATSELSALQQGIEGVTEQTASALESILNSMRFYLATQQGDVREIRDYLLAGQVETTDTESPMLLELQSQTALLRDIRDMWNRVIKSTTNGYMLRVAGIS